MRILIVDDERSARLVLRRILDEVAGVDVVEAGGLDEARRALDGGAIDLALVDIRLGPPANRDGIALLREIRERAAGRPIRAVVVSAFTDGDEIVQAMRHADDYIFKHKLCPEMVVPIIESMREHRKLEEEVLSLRVRVAAPGDESLGLVGTSEPMQRLRAAIRRIAVSDRPVLVIGPTGSGKEMIVRALHALSPHPEDPLLDVNCGAIARDLMESQMFGHERGAFTGADRRQEGALHAVRRGTLFLDEIADLASDLQVKLLRVLETARFRRVGQHDGELRFEGRVVAATHADLAQRVRDGAFREDLFFRLNVITLRVPPLDERREDIPALVAHFCRRQRRQLRFTDYAIASLSRRSWPGNVRALRNLIDRLVVFAESDEISADALAALDWDDDPASPRAAGALDLGGLARAVLKLPAPDKLAAIRAAVVGEAMLLAHGNKTEAGKLLGVHRKTVERLIRGEQSQEPGDDD